MEEVNGYNISQKEFNTLSKWTDNIYNLAVIIDYFCENQPEIEELYNLTPVVKSLHRDANVMNAFFINNEKEVQAMMKGNIGFEKNPVMRVLPSVLKDFGISMVYKIAGEKQTSCLITNVGVLKAPKEMEPYIEKLCLITGPAMINGARCGVLSYKDTLAFNFSNIYKDPVIQREFFTTLIKLGIPVKIESNRHLINGGEHWCHTV